MLNFKITGLVFVLIILVLCVLRYYLDMHIFFFIVPVLLYLSALIYGSFNIGSNFYFHVICSGQSDKKEIAITFDDGPTEDVTPLVLDILKEHDIKATFFCIGEKVIHNESILKRMVSEGHIIGNHTFSHANMFDFYSGKRIIEELTKTKVAIEKTTGKKVKYFRPPFGVTNPTLGRVVKVLNYITIGWSIRTLDTVIKNEKKILSRLRNRIKPGDIVLFHDVNPKVVSILQHFLKHASEKGFKIVGLNELLGIEAYFD